jgi:hypothetical protein
MVDSVPITNQTMQVIYMVSICSNGKKISSQGTISVTRRRVSFASLPCTHRTSTLYL